MIFKNIKCMIVIALASLTSCQENLLETVPDDRLSSNIFWQSDNDAILATNAVYPTLDGINIVSYDGITDLTHTNREFEEDSRIEAGLVSTSTSRYKDEWDDMYAGIRKCNDFMDNIGRITVEDQELVDRLTAEVRTVRAYHYIKLAALYGDVPLITKGIGVNEARSITRTPISDIWDFVSTELEEAAADLPVSYSGKNIGRIKKGGALGLKARAMLYAKRYSEAATAAQKVMELGYNIYPSYYDLFQYAGENCNEILIDHQYAKDVNAVNTYSRLAPWSQVGGSGGSFYVPTKALVDMYDMQNGLPITDPSSGFDPENPYANRDPRLYHSIFLNGDTLPDGKIFNTIPDDPNATDPVGGTLYSTVTGFNIKKYVTPEDQSNRANSGINIILLRYAEVLLTYAEAKIESNNIDQSVYDAINEVRTRADVNMPEITTGKTQSELRAIVRKERAIELSFEGLRLFDIRRWGIAENVMQGTVKGMTYNDDGTMVTIETTGYERGFQSPRDYLWPIPQRERELNPNLDQNPDW